MSLGLRIAGLATAVLVALVLAGAPVPVSAATYLAATITGSAATDSVTVADLATGDTYPGAVYDSGSGAWDLATIPLNDSYFAEVTAPGGEVGLTSAFVHNGSRSGTANTYLDYTASVAMPPHVASAATWNVGLVTTTTATVTTTVLSVYGPLPDAAVEISSTAAGVTLSAPSGGFDLNGTVYAGADSAGEVRFGIADSTPGAAVPITLTSGGVLVATTTVQLVGTGGAVNWPECTASVPTDCWTDLLVDGGPPPAGLTPTVVASGSGDATSVSVLFANSEPPVGSGANTEELFGSGAGQIAPGANISLTLVTGTFLPTALTGTGQDFAWGVRSASGGYQVTATATPTAFSQRAAGCAVDSTTCTAADHDFNGFLAFDLLGMAGTGAPSGYPASPSWSTVLTAMQGVSMTGNAQSQAPPSIDPSTQALQFVVAAPHTTAAGTANTAEFSAFVPDPLVQAYWGLTPSQTTTGSFLGTSDAEGTVSPLPALTVRRITENMGSGTVSGYLVSAGGLSYSTDTIELWPIPAPTLTTAQVKGGSEVDLAWNADTGATGYDVYEAAAAGGPFSIANTSPVNGTGYAVTGLTPTTTYWFEVRAVTASGDTAPSNIMSATTTPADPPAQPTGLTAAPNSSTSVALTWDTDPSATGYNVYAATSAPGPYAKLDASPVPATTYTASSLTSSTTYYFYVTGVNSSGESGASNTVSATTPLLSTMSAPTGLVATPVSGSEVDLSWSTDPGATSYNVYASTMAGGPFRKLNSSAITGTSYAATGLLSNETYYFYATAVASQAETAPSTTVSAMTSPANIAAPAKLTATPVGSSEIDLAWAKVDGVTGYDVYESLAPTAGFVRIGGGPVTGTSYAATALTPATTYYFYVKAEDGGIEGVPSKTVNAATAALTASEPTYTLDGPTAQAMLAQAPLGPNISVPVTVNAGGAGSLAIAPDADSALLSAQKGLTAVFGSTSVTIPAADLDPSQLQQANPSLGSANLVGAQLVFSVTPSGTPSDGSSLGGESLTAAGQAYDVTAALSTPGGTTDEVTSLPAPLQVHLAYDASTITNPALVGVYRLDGSTSPVYSASGLASATSVPATISSLGKYAPMQATADFVDTHGSWAQSAIEVAAAHHLVNGVSATQFDPNAQVTRAEFTAMLARALGLAPAGSDTISSLPFTDVSPTAWYAGTVAAALQDGLVTGVDATQFAPNRPVTREQMAVLVARMLALQGSSSTVSDPGQIAGLLAPFADAGSIDNWAAPAVATMIQDGIMNGRTVDRFDPQATATRAEAAVLLVRALGMS